ncbi:MAG: helix-turn-helix domain-containing protein [Gammaproteobacteria bacterium]|nr:helix-turn-helix domain-containing protein [Gammaproteobacteria bacterium]
MNTNFAKAFRVVRAAYGMQQSELAERIGISASQLSLIEKGKRQPSLKVIGNLSGATGVPTPLITLLASDPSDVVDQDFSGLANTLLRLLVNASEDRQRPLRLEN